MSALEAARAWGVTAEHARVLCRSGAVEGAYKDREGRWRIPAGAQRPTRRGHLSPQSRAELTERAAAGESPTTLSREFGVWRSYVYERKRKGGGS